MRKKKEPTDEKKMYFTQKHQEAIVEYISIDDKRRKNQLFVELIEPVFRELITKIVHKYKFASLPNIQHLKNDCLYELTSILGNFDKSKGSTAFSYFSVCTKNFFYRQMKDTAKKQKRDALFDDIAQYAEYSEHENFLVKNPYENERESEEFVSKLSIALADFEKELEKVNEKKILKAIRVLLEDPYYYDENEIPLNKKSIYLYLRETAKMNTKQISANLQKFRKFYLEFRKKWDNGQI